MPGFASDSVMYALNVDFTGNSLTGGTAQVTLDGQLLIGSAVLPNIQIGKIVSSSLNIGYSMPNITIETPGGGNPVESFTVQLGVNPCVPDGSGNIIFNGVVVSAASLPVQTRRSAVNEMDLEIQVTQAIAGTDITKVGLAAFDSADFTVDGNGFVSATGTGFIKTLTGDTGGAVSPTAGNINILAATVAAGSTPLSVDGNIGTSTLTVNAQLSQAIAGTDVTKVGLAAFNSADFIVDANGFVSSTGGASVDYLNVTFLMSPYTVLTTNYYLSCDTSGGAITLLFPNAPTATQRWIVKDRTGNATVNPITVTTVGGAVNIDGSTSQMIAGNYAAEQLLFNGSTYEIF